ncbi:ABC transporter permease [Burkholderia pseudomallei]|uniref:ABC transporter permease n=1 Tax=Burkholderia pseudomallei TaxID=28450 RepID=UPI00048F32C9|nr:ABC transporter permease [Burkholderia pseudomallei]AJX94492.1 binding--dependent transport system inner membrane component family protein [Burkholderia pseudomallei PB08298010]
MLPPYASFLDRTSHYGVRIVSALVLLFLVLPIFVIIPLSFNKGSFLVYPLEGVSLRWYREVFESYEWVHALRNSVVVAPLSTAIAVPLGTLAAVGLVRSNFPGRELVRSFLMLPMIVPIVIVAVAMYFFFAPLGLTNNFLGLVLGHAALGAPFVVVTVTATLEGYDKNLTRAGKSLGAGPLGTFFRVTLPLILPGVVSGALFAFATSFDEVVLTLFLAGPEQSTLPRQMFAGIRENVSPAIAAVATILIVISISILLTLEWLRGRAQRLRVGTSAGA